MPIYPLYINPYYHPTITYSNYIPLPYGATSQLISISQVPYQQEEYHHRFLIPYNAKFLNGYSQVATTIPTINNYPSKTKILQYTQNDNTFPHNSGDFQNYNKPEKEINGPIDGIPIDITNKMINHNHLNSLNQMDPIKDKFEEPIKIYQTKDEEHEKLKPTRDQKKLDIIDDLSNSMSTEPNQINESQELSFSTTDIKLNTSSPPKNTLIKTYAISTIEPIASSEIPSQSDMINNQESHIPFDTNYHLTDTSTPTAHFFSGLFSTQKPFSSTEQPESTFETETITPEGNNYEETSTDGENYQLPETRQVQPNSQFMDNKKAKLRTLYTPIKTEEKSLTEITKTLNRESTSPYSTTKYVSTPTCENNDCLTSSHIVVQSTYPSLHSDPFQMRSAYSTPQSPTIITSKNDLQSDLTKPSTPSSPSFIKYNHSIISETTTLPGTSLHSSTVISPSLSPFLEITTSNQTSFEAIPSNKINDIRSTNLHNSSSVPALLPLTNEKSKSSVLLETKTEQTLSIPIIYNKNKEKNNQNTHTPSSYDESTNQSHLTTIMIPSNGIPNQKPIVKIDQNIQPIGNNTSFRSSINEKENIHDNDKTHNIITAGETKKNSLITTTSPIKSSYSSNQRHSQLVTDPADSKHTKSDNNRNRQTTETLENYKDSDPWYKYMYNQKPQKKELNDEQIEYLLQKLVKSLTYEIEKQTVSKENVAKLLAPQLGDQIYIIHPLGKTATKLMETEGQTKNNTGQLKNVNEQ